MYICFILTSPIWEWNHLLPAYKWGILGLRKIHDFLKDFSAAAKSLQSCPTLCDPIDSGLPGSPVPGILQARTLEWVAISFSNLSAAAAAAKSLQSCPTLCYPIDGSPPGSSVPGILQARILEWVAISFSNAWKWKVKVKSLSRAQLLVTPFSRQEYWSGVPLPSPNLSANTW